MTTIDKETVKHLAELARIAVTEAELEVLTKNLATILDYVDELKAVNTDGLPEIAQVTGLKNVLREDVARADLPAAAGDSEVYKKLLDAFPGKENNYLKVKAIFE